MGRIRTIKPEFPHSESMGRVSRDARLLFILLWTLADDSGRLRGDSRMLASLLFPYDDDAGTLISGWIGELEREGCCVRYHVNGSTFLEVRNWLAHQKIDRPSQSKIPPFDEHSRILDEHSRAFVLGPRTKEGTKEGTKEVPKNELVNGKPLTGQSPLGNQNPGIPTPEEFFARYQSFARRAGITVPEDLTPERRKKLKTRLAAPKWFDTFTAACKRVPVPNNEHFDWQPDLDWFIANNTNATKVAEGKYEKHKANGVAPKKPSAYQDLSAKFKEAKAHDDKVERERAAARAATSDPSPPGGDDAAKLAGIRTPETERAVGA